MFWYSIIAPFGTHKVILDTSRPAGSFGCFKSVTSLNHWSSIYKLAVYQRNIMAVTYLRDGYLELVICGFAGQWQAGDDIHCSAMSAFFGKYCVKSTSAKSLFNDNIINWG